MKKLNLNESIEVEPVFNPVEIPTGYAQAWLQRCWCFCSSLLCTRQPFSGPSQASVSVPYDVGSKQTNYSKLLLTMLK